jgi:hypothetical protein
MRVQDASALISNSGHGHCERMTFCYLKPCSLWYFVMVVLGSEYRKWDDVVIFKNV